MNQGFESHRKHISSDQNWGIMLKSLSSSPKDKGILVLEVFKMNEHLWVHKVAGGLGDLYRSLEGTASSNISPPGRQKEVRNESWLPCWLGISF